MQKDNPSGGKLFTNLSPRTRILAILLLIVLFIAVFVRKQAGVILQQLLGPASGTSSENSVQVMGLSSPVSLTQEGITLRIEELTIGSDQTNLTYTLSGVPADETPPIAYLQTLNGSNYVSQDYQQTVIENGASVKSYRVSARFEAMLPVSDIRFVWERRPTAQVVTSDVWVIPVHLFPVHP